MADYQVLESFTHGPDGEEAAWRAAVKHAAVLQRRGLTGQFCVGAKNVKGSWAVVIYHSSAKDIDAQRKAERRRRQATSWQPVS